MTEHETGARRGLPGEGTGMTPPPPGFEQPQQVDRMNVLGHCEPVEFEVCERSGQLPWECGLAACENGCATKTVEFVPAATYRGAVEACLAQWVIAHGVKCGCENPDTAGCDWPVPVPHTQAALDAALGGQ